MSRSLLLNSLILGTLLCTGTLTAGAVDAGAQSAQLLRRVKLEHKPFTLRGRIVRI